MLVTLPFLLLLLDFWPLQRIDWSEPQKRWDSMVALLKEKIPFFVLTIVVSYITYSAQESRMAGTQAPAGVAVTIRLANAVVACVGYLKQTFIPINLCVHYPIKTIEQIGAVNLIAALFLLAVITGLVVKFWREQPVLTMGWFWFLGLLVPVSGIVQAGNMIQADRFTYLPGIGLMICLVWGLSAVAVRMLLMKRLVIAVVCAVIGTMVVLSQHQIKSWHDTESVFNQVVKVFPDNHVALSSLAEIDLQKGKIQDAQAKVDRVLKIEPGYPRGECMQATLLQMQGKMKEAIPHLERSIGPEVEMAAQARLVLSYLDGGRLAEADAGIERLLNVVPRDPALWLMKAAILKEQRQVAEALEIFKKVTAVYPDPPADTSTMYYSLAELFGIAGESKKAAVYYAKALEITPQSVGVLNDFAWLLATSPLDDVRNGSLAVQYAERACELSRWNQPVAMGTLAAAYAESGRFGDALKMAERARDKANAQGASVIAQRNAELLELYRANKPYREQSL